MFKQTVIYREMISIENRERLSALGYVVAIKKYKYHPRPPASYSAYRLRGKYLFIFKPLIDNDAELIDIIQKYETNINNTFAEGQ